ncbi:PREDICTED: lysozyme C, milk isozyme-like [Tinamus guttatus]|uniref:lysozyme C, milk isozyme-like n=1 Tax=Tinamus guttatus TaxID=94827 RepID=UPI00052E7C6D|nr:PREDICTED: lysozyme C, milk isozyme-like [Tinamus guttatus]
MGILERMEKSAPPKHRDSSARWRKLLGREEGDGYRGYSLADWLCMAFYESNFDTAAKSINADSSASFGIFQINNRLWCTDERSPSENLCRVACADLLTSDITDDILCAKKIVRHPQGMDAWEDWAMHCKGRDLSEWVEGCDL